MAQLFRSTVFELTLFAAERKVLEVYVLDYFVSNFCTLKILFSCPMMYVKRECACRFGLGFPSTSVSSELTDELKSYGMCLLTRYTSQSICISAGCTAATVTDA